jgi:hypothetical protein
MCCSEQHIPIDYLTVNINSWEKQRIPIDYLTVNIDSWEEQHIPIDYLTVNIEIFCCSSQLSIFTIG